MPHPPTTSARVTAPAPSDAPAASSPEPMQVKSEPLASAPIPAAAVKHESHLAPPVAVPVSVHLPLHTPHEGDAHHVSAVAPTAPAVPARGRTAPTPPLCGKNLRWTAVALARKLRSERERPSTALCDEVAADAAAEMRALHPGRDVSGVERNTRRRVYDALKVMTSLGCVARGDANPAGGGRMLRWESPTRSATAARSPQLRTLAAKVAAARKRLCDKRAQARELGRQLQAFDDNAKRAAAGDPAAPRIRFPFLLVPGDPLRAPLSVAPSSLELTYAYPVTLYTETDVVDLLYSHRTAPRNKKRPRVPRQAATNATPVAPPLRNAPPAAAPVVIPLPAPPKRKAAPQRAVIRNRIVPPTSTPSPLPLPPPPMTTVVGGVVTVPPTPTAVTRTPVKEEARFLLSPATPVALLEGTQLHRTRAALVGYSGGGMRSDIDDLGDLSCLDDADFGQDHS